MSKGRAPIPGTRKGAHGPFIYQGGNYPHIVLSPCGWLNPVVGEFLADVLQILVSRLFIPLLVRGGLNGAVYPIFGLG